MTSSGENRKSTVLSIGFFPILNVKMPEASRKIVQRERADTVFQVKDESLKVVSVWSFADWVVTPQCKAQYSAFRLFVSGDSGRRSRMASDRITSFAFR